MKFERRAVWIDGQETRIAAGTMHYFRIPREYWRARMEKALEMGLNAIETYLCWNLHERREGSFDFSGNLDFEAYLKLAQELGLYVVLRPGPYICSEWDNGALPSWLATKPGIRYRRYNAQYVDAIAKYFSVLVPRIRALQYDAGGPVIAIQVENEYGSYASDKKYLAFLRDLYRDGGITVPLFTADGREALSVMGGTVDGASMCLNFGTKSYEAFDLGREMRPDDPPFCAEFWCGWFDAWGREHHTRSAASAAAELDDMLSQGANVIFYAFCGGTNFGMVAGANGSGARDYAPDTTSYDFDALLTESGEPTEKFFACRDVLARHGFKPRAVPGATKVARRDPCAPDLKLRITGTAPLLGNGGCLGAVADRHVEANSAPTFEELGQDFGYVYYKTHVAGPAEGSFTLRQVRDRANVYLDGRQIAVYYRNDESNATPRVSVPAGGAELSLLVENLGRINYGPRLGFDTKGICEDVAFEWQAILGWEAWSLGLDNPDDGRVAFAPFGGIVRGAPAFYLSEFEVDEPADAWLVFPGVHGAVWLNGHPIGRYWEIGPTKTLYLPGCWMRRGANRIVVFETEKLEKDYLSITGTPVLG